MFARRYALMYSHLLPARSLSPRHTFSPGVPGGPQGQVFGGAVQAFIEVEGATATAPGGGSLRSAGASGGAGPGQPESRRDHLLRGAFRRHTTRLGPLPPFHRAIRPLRRYPEEIFRRAGIPQRTPTAHKHTGRCRPVARNGPRPSAGARPSWTERSPQLRLAKARAEPAVAAPGAAAGAWTVQTRTPHRGFASARSPKWSMPGMAVPGTAESSMTPVRTGGFLGSPTHFWLHEKYAPHTGRRALWPPCPCRKDFKFEAALQRIIGKHARWVRLGPAGTALFVTSSGSAIVPGSQTAGCVCGVHG
jgi:hypothetical protein